MEISRHTLIVLLFMILNRCNVVLIRARKAAIQIYFSQQWILNEEKIVTWSLTFLVTVRKRNECNRMVSKLECKLGNNSRKFYPYHFSASVNQESRSYFLHALTLWSQLNWFSYMSAAKFALEFSCSVWFHYFS